MSVRPFRRSRALRPLAALGVVLALAACTGPSGLDDLGREAEPTPDETFTESSSPPPAVTCEDATESYDPAGSSADLASLPGVQEIRDRGSIVAGVSADTHLLGGRNPFTGDLEGFDIDVVRDLSTAIFGTPDRVTYRVITSGDRVPVLESGEVDVVVRAFTMTCARWEQIAFSSEYYHAGQKVLVESDSTATSLDDLAGQKVCAPAGTTTLTRLADYPQVEAVSADTHTACLALFQQGQVDAITGDDTVLAGLAAQDPYAKVVGEAISDEPYGVGIAPDQVDLVRFVNAVIEQRKADGTWAASYERWLSVLGATPTPPVGDFGRG